MSKDEGLEEKTTVISGDSETLKLEMKKLEDSEACLIIIRGTPQGKKFPITMPSMIIGRDTKTSDIRINDGNVSRKNTEIIKETGRVLIKDMGSTNGTFLNDKPVSGDPVELKKEDMIKVGNTILKYLPKGAIEIMSYDAATVDSMLQIYNKKFIMEALDAEFKRAKSTQGVLSIIMFDIDHFKKINDTHGHDAGDFVLKELIKILKSGVIRSSDILGRYGGEEFLLVLPETVKENASAIAERMRTTVESHSFTYNNQTIPVTISLGVSSAVESFGTPQEYFKSSDEALYQSKDNGRNKVTIA